jgi:hypothetical protein
MGAGLMVTLEPLAFRGGRFFEQTAEGREQRARLKFALSALLSALSNLGGAT